MNRLLIRCFLPVFILAFSQKNLAETGHENLSSIQKNHHDQEEVRADHLKYFGFYASAMAGLPNSTAEISSFANVTWVAYGAELESLADARNHGMKAIVDVMRFFFDGNFKLLPDYESRWNQFAAEVAPFVNDGTIVAFYPIDEPFMDRRMKASGRNKRQTKDVLETIGAAIKRTFPHVPLALILGGDQWDGYIVPTNFDWIGFDHYDCWENCGGHSIPEIHAHLVSKLTNPNQRTILVPDVWKWSFGKPKNAEVKDMITLFNKFVKLAKAKPKVIGMFGFIYQDLPKYRKDGSVAGVYPGTNGIPKLKERVMQVGQEIKNSQTF